MSTSIDISRRNEPSEPGILPELHSPKEQFLFADNEEAISDDELSRPGFVKNDRVDMQRMGKRQELIRNFAPFAALSFTVVLQATWEFFFIANSQGLVDGGLAGLFWSYIWTFIGYGFIELSMAEMASMAPTSGGQYHWVSEFAPPQYQKFLSYLTGWMSVLSWQAGTASGSYLTGTMIQALITVNFPTYEPTNWQGTLLIFAMVLILYIFNFWGASTVPQVQNYLLGLHVVLFFVIVVILWIKAPHVPATAVFTQFSNGGGWSSMGLSLMVGQLTAIFTLFCGDATAHMSEEVQDAGIAVPQAMIRGYLLNGSIGLIIVITYLFCLTSIDSAINDPSGFPFIWVFRQAVSTSGINALTILLIIIVILSNVSFNASTSRQTFAFARDKGLPFSNWISAVHPTKQIPANAVALTCTFTLLLSLINIGSSVAFNAIISLQVVALMLSYTISIGSVLYRRLKYPELLPRARYSLGRWGMLVNAVSVTYSSFGFFWCFWPNSLPVDMQSFNWSVVIFLGIFVISVVMYLVKGRYLYDGPVSLVQRRQE